MFFGIVEERREAVTLILAPDDTDARVTIRGHLVTQDVRYGDWIAVAKSVERLLSFRGAATPAGSRP